jgi:hypothetical protein
MGFELMHKELFSKKPSPKIVAIGIVLSIMMMATLTSVNAEETWFLTISTNNSAWGTTNPAEGEHEYPKYLYGYIYSFYVTATPNEGYAFAYWIHNGEYAGSGIGESHAIEIFSDRGNQTLTAIFEESEAGDWIQNYIHGDWLMCSRTNWTAEYEDYKGEAKWTKSLTNFTGYSANFSMDYFTVQRVWWGERASEQFWLTYNFTGSNNHSVTMEIRIGNAEYLWGLLKGIPQIMVTTNETTEFGSMIAGEIFNIYAWQHNNSGLAFRVLAYRDVNGNPLTIPINLCDVEFDVGESWFENVSLSMTAKHGGGEYGYGFGTFSLTLEDFIKENEGWTPDWQIWETPYYPTIFDLIIGAIRGVMPKWAIDAIDTLHLYGVQLFTFIGSIVINITTTTLPFLPMILVFWFLDVIMTAVTMGNLQPFGVMIMTIYHFVATVITGIVIITQTIWDFIKFW